jgi:hypothetical protein
VYLKRGSIHVRKAHISTFQTTLYIDLMALQVEEAADPAFS